MSSKSINVVLSYTVSKSARSLRHSCSCSCSCSCSSCCCCTKLHSCVLSYILSSLSYKTSASQHKRLV